jgi:hypothetical protein
MSKPSIYVGGGNNLASLVYAPPPPDNLLVNPNLKYSQRYVESYEHPAGNGTSVMFADQWWLSDWSEQGYELVKNGNNGYRIRSNGSNLFVHQSIEPEIIQSMIGKRFQMYADVEHDSATGNVMSLCCHIYNSDSSTQLLNTYTDIINFRYGNYVNIHQGHATTVPSGAHNATVGLHIQDSNWHTIRFVGFTEGGTLQLTNGRAMNPTLELLQLYRYYQILGNQGLGGLYNRSSKELLLNYVSPVPMRVLPSVSFSKNAIGIWHGTSGGTGTISHSHIYSATGSHNNRTFCIQIFLTETPDFDANLTLPSHYVYTHDIGIILDASF